MVGDGDMFADEDLAILRCVVFHVCGRLWRLAMFTDSGALRV